MVRLAFGLPLALLVACTPEASQFRHLSVVETQSHGVTMPEDEPGAHVGMLGNTCAIDTSTGMIGADSDVAVGEDDHVQDEFGHQVVVQAASGTYVIDRDLLGMSTQGLAQDESTTARLYADGVAALRPISAGGCQIDWNRASPAELSGISDCAEVDFSVDRRDGTAFLPLGDALVIASAEAAVTSVDLAADAVAFDAASELVYVTNAEGRTVTAVNRQGVLAWSVQTEGPIVAVDDMGDSGRVAVMLKNEDASGTLLVLEGGSGEEVARLDTPSAADRIVSGNHGRTLAFVLSDEIHFFSVDLGAE